jgi:hypothetical protein
MNPNQAQTIKVGTSVYVQVKAAATSVRSLSRMPPCDKFGNYMSVVQECVKNTCNDQKTNSMV